MRRITTIPAALILKIKKLQKLLTGKKANANMRASSVNAEHRSALAQSVEQMTVNHWVAGSSPAGGAKLK